MQNQKVKESQWQRASEGENGLLFPWENDFKKNKSHGIQSEIKSYPNNLTDWRKNLMSLLESSNYTPLIPVQDNNKISLYGVVGMSGNYWEWTSTNRQSRGSVNPTCCSKRNHIDLVYDYRSFTVLKGGAWTSINEMLSKQSI